MFSNLKITVEFLLTTKNHIRAIANANETVSGCGYWNYSTWIANGVYTSSPENIINDEVISCYAEHLTQFAFLLGGSFRQQSIEDICLISAEIHERALNYITLLGINLSLFSLLGIWLTAAFLKKWRQQASTKILLNFCLSLTFQLLIYGLVETYNSVYKYCVLKGALLQYSVLVIFSWMLLIARLQFQRYVKVIGVEQPKHYILRAAILAWLMPLLPTLLVLLFDPDSYQPQDEQLLLGETICYPSGYSLASGVVVPIGLIIAINLVIVFRIFKSDFQMKDKSRRQISQSLSLFVLLFFLLGLSWIFGLLSYWNLGLVFSYLFCITAPLQGFMLFVYFVVLKEEPRKFWMTLLNCSHLPDTNSSEIFKNSKHTESVFYLFRVDGIYRQKQSEETL